MFNFRFLALLFFFCLLGLAVQAQKAFSSLEEAWTYADQHNITIQTARINERIQQANTRQSVAAALPQISATGQYTDNWGLPTTLLPAALVGGKKDSYIPIKFGQQYVINGGFTASLDVMNAVTWYNIKAAAANTALARAQTGNNRKSVYEQVATQFYGVQLAQKAYELAVLGFNLSDTLYHSSQEKFNSGLISEPALQTTLINRLRSKQSMSDAHILAKEQLNNFKLLLDFPLSDSVFINSTWTEGAIVNPKEAYQTHPAITIATIQRDVSLYGLRASVAQFLPTLSLFANLSTQQNNNDFKPLGKDITWYQSKYWGLKLNVPLFTGGSRFFATQKSKYALEQSTLQLDYITKQSALEDANLWLDYAKNMEDLTNSKKVMQLYLDIFRHKNQQYHEGLASLDDVSLALNDYINYENTYLNVLSGYFISLYKIKIRQTTF